MLTNTITLPVDGDRTSTAVDQVYTRFSEAQDKTVYVRSDHSIDERHELAIIRRFPSRSGNFKGTQKVTLKFTDDYTVAGVDGSDIVAPVIEEHNMSIPVGVAIADVLATRMRGVALLADTEVDATFERNEI